MTYTIPTPAMINVVACVFARHLVNELSYRNYPECWLKPPLQSLLPYFYSVLNHHPKRIGDIIDNAVTSERINRLPHQYPELFGLTRQLYIDEYSAKVRGLQGYWNGRPEVPEILPRSELRAAFETLMDTFACLKVNQENEHRTLEHISYPFALLLDVCGEYDAAFDVEEYADQWRTLDSSERVGLRNEIRNRQKS